MKRVDWLDTLRVLAAFIVLLSHFSYMANSVPSVQNFISRYLLFIGQIGNMLFFAVSGYLAANSIEHAKNLLEYYRRKIIRITIPYTTAYIFLASLLILLGMLEPKIAEQSPFHKIINVGGDYTVVFFGILPLASDFNLIHFFQIPMQNFTTESFVGEWFIGTIIYLYLISPLLYKLLRWNSAATLITSIIIAGVLFDFSEGWKDAGYIFGGRSLFPVRLPEFLLGMILFLHKDFLDLHAAKLNKIFLSAFAAMAIYAVFFNSAHESFWVRIIFGCRILDAVGTPENIWQYLFFNVVIVYLLYVLALYLNKNFCKVMEPFNSLSTISYVAMLMNRVVIYRFALSYDFSTLSKFGVFFMFAAAVLTIIFLSERIRRIYKPLEERLIKKKLFLE